MAAVTSLTIDDFERLPAEAAETRRHPQRTCAGSGGFSKTVIAASAAGVRQSSSSAARRWLYSSGMGKLNHSFKAE